jgi:hypothetical protein
MLGSSDVGYIQLRSVIQETGINESVFFNEIPHQLQAQFSGILFKTWTDDIFYRFSPHPSHPIFVYLEMLITQIQFPFYPNCEIDLR